MKGMEIIIRTLDGKVRKDGPLCDLKSVGDTWKSNEFVQCVHSWRATLVILRGDSCDQGVFSLCVA